MLRSIFLKTLFEKRWGILGWSVAMFALMLFVVVLFPTFKDSFGASLGNVPDSLKSLFGEAVDYQRIEGFVELQGFMQMVFVTFIYGIILFTGLIAGEEGDGTLQSLLAQPVSRSRVYLEKLLAGAAILGIVSLAMALAVFVGVAFIGESIDAGRVMQATFMQWLVAMVLSLVGYAIGATTGRRGMAGALAGIFAFASYMVTTLVTTVEALQPANYLSPFKYFNNTRILDNGLQLSNVSVLVAACLVLAFIGWAVFVRRDIYSR